MSNGQAVFQGDAVMNDLGTVLSPEVQSKTLGRFQLDRLLGKGQMGEAWKAYDPTREDYVVVKILPSELQSNTRELERVKRSFLCIQKLQHQHICPVYDLGVDSETGNYLVMKFLPFGTLDDYVAEYFRQHGAMPVEEAARVLRPIAEALDYAHSQGVVHRDLKPANILVSGDGEDAQLIDFGLAAEIRTSLTRTTRAVTESPGTLAYMSTEQWRGRQVDGRADQYAFAVLLYELFAGRLPFESADATVLRQCVLEEAVEAIPGLPLPVNAALARGLAKQPDDRFPSCVALMEAMLSHENGRASPLGSAKSLPEILAIPEPMARVKAAGELLTVLLRSLLPPASVGVDLRGLSNLLPRAMEEDGQQSYFLTVTHLELLNALETWQQLTSSDADAAVTDEEDLARTQSAWVRAINDLLPHAPATLSSAIQNSIHAQFPMSEAAALLAQRVTSFAKKKYSHWQGLPKPQRLKQAVIAAASIVLLGWGLPTTYSWLSPERAARSARTAAEKERTTALQAAADRKASNLFQPAESEFQTQGVRQYDAQDYRAARAAFERSQDGFKKARVLANQVTSCETARTTAQASLTAADQAQGSVRCPDKWRDARQSFDSGEQRFSTSLYPEAEKEFRQAKSLFDTIKSESATLITAEDDAKKALNAAKASSKDAEQAQAAKLCPTAWEKGQAKLTEAEQSFAAKDYRVAYQQANDAKSQLMAAARDSQNLSRVQTDAEKARTAALNKKSEAEKAKSRLVTSDEAETKLFDEQAFTEGTTQTAQAESDWGRQDFAAARDGYRRAEQSFQKVISRAEQLRPRSEAAAARRTAQAARESALQGGSDKLAEVRQWREAENVLKQANVAFDKQEFANAKKQFEQIGTLCQEAATLVNLLQEIDQAQIEVQRLGVEESFLDQHGGEVWREMKRLIGVVRSTADFGEQQKAAERVRKLLPQALNVGRVIRLFKDKKHDEALDLLLTSWPNENDPNRRALFNSCAPFVPKWWWSQVEKSAAEVTGKNEQLLISVILANAAGDVGATAYHDSVKKAHELAETMTDSEFQFDGLMALALAQKKLGDRTGVRNTLKLAERTVNLLNAQPRQLAGWEYRELVSVKSWGFAQLAGLYRWLEDDTQAWQYELSSHRLIDTNFGQQNYYLTHPSEHFTLMLVTDGIALPKRVPRTEELRQGQFVFAHSQNYRNDQIQRYRHGSALLALRAAEMGLKSLYISGRSSANELNRETSQESVSMLYFRAYMADAALQMNDLDDARTLVLQIEQSIQTSFRQQTQYLPYLRQLSQISQAMLAEIQAKNGKKEDNLKAQLTLDFVPCEMQNTINNRYDPVHRGLMAHRRVSAMLAARDDADLSELYNWAKKRTSPLTRTAALVGLTLALEQRTNPSAGPARLNLVSHTATKSDKNDQEQEDQLQLSSNAEANRHLQNGVAEYAQENWRGAHDHFGQALQVDPQFKAALKLRADCHWRMGKVAAAIRDAKKADWQPRVALINDATLKSGEDKIAALPRGKWVEVSDIEGSWLKVTRYLDANGDVQKPEHAWVLAKDVSPNPDLNDHVESGSSGQTINGAQPVINKSGSNDWQKYQQSKPIWMPFVPGKARGFIP